MTSYCKIAKKSCKKADVSPEKLKGIVKTVAEEEDRSKKLVVFSSLKESNEDLGTTVSEQGHVQVTTGQLIPAPTPCTLNNGLCLTVPDCISFLKCDLH